MKVEIRCPDCARPWHVDRSATGEMLCPGCMTRIPLEGLETLQPVDEPAPPQTVRRRPEDLPQAVALTSEDWPQFRGNALRSGVSKTEVPTALKQAWKADIGGRLSQPVVTGGMVLVSAVDANTVYALDEKTGKEVWKFIAGGRVDSPPAVHEGRVMFGCADGRVYCLNFADGKLAWRFMAARAVASSATRGRYGRGDLTA